MNPAVTTFQVSTRASGRRRTVRVKIYDDLPHLQADAARYAGRPGWFDDAYAVAHAYTTETAAGLIRYWRQGIGTSVVTHEAVHIASGIYRRDWEPDHGPVHQDLENEEVLCYLVGDLSRRIVNQLYRRGFYDDV